jgi:hypothetical protein
MIGGWKGILELLVYRVRQSKTWVHRGPFDIPALLAHSGGAVASQCSIPGAVAGETHVGGAITAQMDG